MLVRFNECGCCRGITISVFDVVSLELASPRIIVVATQTVGCLQMKHERLNVKQWGGFS